MGTNERRQREKEALREKIIKAASDLFLEHGFAGTSIRMIAKEIEYSPATVYLHFGDKKELFFIIMERAFGKFHQYLSRVLKVEDPMERLMKLGEEYLTFVLENPMYYDLMFVVRAPMDTEHTKEGWEGGMVSHQILTKTVQECIDKGHFKGHEAEGLSLAIWSSVHGIATLYLRNRLAIYGDQSEALVMHALNEFNIMMSRQ